MAAASSTASTPAQADPELAYTRLSPTPGNNASSPSPSPPTIVFLHGGESCHLEFSRVAPFLADDYDILLVDLPGHSRSRAIPFSLDNAVRGLSRLITAHAAGGRAHVVGLSLGGFVGLALARECPALVQSLWCTGCAPFSGYRLWFMEHPRLLSGLIVGASRLATERVFWATLGVEPVAGLRAEVRRNQSMALLTAIYAELARVTMADVGAIRGVRVAMVAGGRQDSVPDTAEAGRVLQRENAACRAYVVRQAIHWWSLQLPEVFAQGVRAWIEGTEMPAVYEPLPGAS